MDSAMVRAIIDFLSPHGFLEVLKVPLRLYSQVVLLKGSAHASPFNKTTAV
jgi:hypothetical protein